MAKRSKQYPLFKITATLFGAVLCGLETSLNAQFFAQLDGWVSPMVAIVAVASLGAAAALPIRARLPEAEQAERTCLALFFLAMVACTAFVTYHRLDGRHEGEVTSTRSSNERVRLAKEAYEAAKATKEAECGKRGPKCRAAEQAVTKAREGLSAKPVERSEESEAKRIGASILSLLFPLGSQLGGFAFLHVGLSPRRREPADPVKEKPKARKPRKRRKTPVSAVERHSNVVPLRTKGR
jgi:hypothetical protein